MPRSLADQLPSAELVKAKGKVAAHLPKANRAGRGKDAQPCTHWWVIESPNGATCKARCKRCKATRVFSSTGEDDKWLGSMAAKRFKGGETVSRQARQFGGGSK